MVMVAQPSAPRLGLADVVVRQLHAEAVKADEGSLRTAFSRCIPVDNRSRGEDVCDLLDRGEPLAVLGPGGIHSGTLDWTFVTRDVLTQYFGSERRAGTGVYREGERHE